MRAHSLFIALMLGTFACLSPSRAHATVVSGVVEIDHPEAYTQVLALSDVHGMYAPLVELLTHAGVIDEKHHWSAGKSLLIITGDSIDKGSQSIDVLDLWIALSKEAPTAGGRVVHLLGNHEAEFLAYGKKGKKSEEFLEELKEKEIRVRELRDSGSVRGHFLHTMPVAAKVGRWLFSHAGFLPEGTWAAFTTHASALIDSGNYEDPLFIGEDSILEAKDWWAKAKHRRRYEELLEAQGFYGIVQGHQPKAYGIKNRIGAIEEGRFIKLDCGMAPVAGSHPGSLLKFSTPAELNEKKAPKAQTISSDGKTEALIIE